MNFFSNSQIDLGRLVLSTFLLYILIGIAAGSVFLIIITKNNRTSRKISSDLITNFILIVILTWKLMPVFLAPGNIISSPVSILYSSGGIPGIILGIGFGIVYMGIKFFLFRKHPVGENGHSNVRDILKPVIVFFVSAAFVSISLFFVSWMVRNGDLGDYSAETPKLGVSTGDVALDFKLMDTEGNLIHLNDYKGKWVILNFWATWCPPCRGELPTLIRFYKQADKDNIVLLGINASNTEKPANRRDVRSYVSTFVAEKGINYKILLDTKGNVSTVYGAKTLPTTVVISPKGLITKIKTGVIDSFWLRSATN